MVVDDDSIAFAYTLTGTHRGEFVGDAASGRAIEVRGRQIGRYADGRIVESRGVTDTATLMAQIRD